MKNLLILFTMLFLITSCEEELPPTPDPVPADNVYNKIIVETDQSLAIDIDSIVYVNSATNFKQKVEYPSAVPVTCNNIDYNNHELTLTENYISGDNCDVTIYFATGQTPIAFRVLLLKPTENSCDDTSGNGTPYTAYTNSITITKTQ